MRTYNRLKPFFVRGVFHGIAENVHLHTLPAVAGGVVNAFNLTDEEQTVELTLPRAPLGLGMAADELPVSGAGDRVSLQEPRLRQQFERGAMARTKQPEVALVEGKDARNAKSLGQRRDHAINVINARISIAGHQSSTSRKVLGGGTH